VKRAATVERRRNLQVVYDFLGRVNARTSPIPSLEEDNYRMREGFQHFAVELVEEQNPDKSFLEIAHQPAESADFFTGSMQRTQLVGHIELEGHEVPLHYVIVSSIILRRDDRAFHAWKSAIKHEYILAPMKFLPKAEKLEEEFSGDLPVTLQDTGGDELNYTQLRIAAVNRARDLKWETRYDLLASWKKEEGLDPNKLNIINDSLLHTDNDELTENMIGFLRMVYVPFENRDQLSNHLMLDEFQRGQLFKIIDPEKTENTKYSWFLRIRQIAKAEPEYGLVRLEILAQNDEEALRHADDFSCLVVRERFPVTFPAPQWDKLIFPHKLCDQYLSSLVPSSETIQSYFMSE